MEKAIYHFFKTRVSTTGGSLLLGCSGGPDSKALLYLLSSFCRKHKVRLLVAHIDHGWRKESSLEAALLQKEVESMGWSFYLKIVDCKEFGSGNWESKGRDIRLRFFQELYCEKGVQALFLGHHADDRAEGVLKRLFEGSSFFHLGGMGTDIEMQGMRILRPLLSYPKEKIFDFLKRKGISYFSDPTNLDPSFLRGRMRSEMLPFLQNSFGKNIGKNLCLFADETREVVAYFSSLNRSFLEGGREGVLDLKEKLPLPEIQLRYLLREWLERQNLVFSRSILHSAVSLLLRGGAGKFSSGSSEILIRNGVISIIV